MAQKKDTERESKESEDKDRSKNEAGTEIEEEHEDNNTEDVKNKSSLKKQKQGTQEAGNDLMWAQVWLVHYIVSNSFTGRMINGWYTIMNTQTYT